jgi:hypothetical protein
MSGFIEGVYGAVHRRELSTLLPVSLLWLVLVAGVQFAAGNPLFAP